MVIYENFKLMRNKKSDLDSVGVLFPSQHISAENKLGVAVIVKELQHKHHHVGWDGGLVSTAACGCDHSPSRRKYSLVVRPCAVSIAPVCAV